MKISNVLYDVLRTLSVSEIVVILHVDLFPGMYLTDAYQLAKRIKNKEYSERWNIVRGLYSTKITEYRSIWSINDENTI